MSDRRKYERYLMKKLALLQLANGRTLQGETRDMSKGGVFLRFQTDNDLVVGESFRISLVLKEGNEETTTEMEGQVSHRSSSGVGITFLKINADYYQFIDELSE